MNWNHLFRYQNPPPPRTKSRGGVGVWGERVRVGGIPKNEPLLLVLSPPSHNFTNQSLPWQQPQATSNAKLASFCFCSLFKSLFWLRSLREFSLVFPPTFGARGEEGETCGWVGESIFRRFDSSVVVLLARLFRFWFFCRQSLPLTLSRSQILGGWKVTSRGDRVVSCVLSLSMGLEL